MDVVYELLEEIKRHGYAVGNFLGLLHVLIGRKLEKADGTVISTGLTWRELAALLKKCRWDKEAVRELGLNPADLPPRDRQRYWYTAISQAHVASQRAAEAGERLAEVLRAAGYVVSRSPA